LAVVLEAPDVAAADGLDEAPVAASAAVPAPPMRAAVQPATAIFFHMMCS
jgi:hypothetical protein